MLRKELEKLFNININRDYLMVHYHFMYDDTNEVEGITLSLGLYDVKWIRLDNSDTDRNSMINVWRNNALLLHHDINEAPELIGCASESENRNNLAFSIFRMLSVTQKSI